jgi:DNA-directed RNA polymerase subunit alpha
VLNFKQLLVKLDTDQPVRLKIETSQKGDVTGADVLCPPEASIVNTGLKICTLSQDVPLRIEAEARKGRGYVTAEENEPEDRELDVIYIDSIFSPVRRVNFKVENTRVGKLTNYDRLLLNIWTDGTVSPDLALIEASKIMRKHLNCLVHYPGVGAAVEGDLPAETAEPIGLDADLARRLGMPISDLNLSVRASNCIESENIRTIGELVVRDENQLLSVRNFGKTTLKEIQDKLVSLDLFLGMDVGDYLQNLETT